MLNPTVSPSFTLLLISVIDFAFTPLALKLSKKLKCPFLDIDKVILNSELIVKEDRTLQISKMKSQYFIVF